MKEVFIPYATALLAKEKGFDEPCFAFISESEIVIHRFRTIEECRNSNVDGIAVPIYQQLVDWFREKYFMEITIRSICSVNEVLYTVGNIDFMINKFQRPDIVVEGDFDYYKTFNNTFLAAFKQISC